MRSARSELLFVVLWATSASPGQDLKSVEKLRAEGRIAEAESGARALLEKEQAQGPESFETGQALDLFVKVLQQAGKAGEPETALLARRAIGIKEKTRGPESRQTAVSLINLAAVLNLAGDYSGALPAFERARRILETEGRSGDPTLFACLSGQAFLFQTTGRVAEARDLFACVLAEREKALGPDHSAVASSLNNLAMCLADMGDAPGALPLESRALEIWSRQSPRDPLDVGTGLNNLGWITFLAGDIAGSKSFFERSLALREPSLGRDHPYVASTVENLALALDAAKDPMERAEGIARHRQALDSRVRSLGPDHPWVARGRRYLAQALAAAGRTTEAIDEAILAEEAGRQHLRWMAQGMSEREALLFREARDLSSAKTSGLDIALSLAVRTDDGAVRRRIFDAVIRSRAVVLDTIRARRRGSSAADPEALHLLDDLRQTAQIYSNLRVRGPLNEPPEAYRRRLDALRAQLDAAERTLGEKNGGFRAAGRTALTGIDEVLQALPPRSALVSYARHGEGAGEYTAFVLRAGEKTPAVADLGSAKEIDELVGDWREEAAHGLLLPGRSRPEAEAAYRRKAAELRQRVWDPLEPRLRDAREVFVVPDGDLQLMSFPALPDGESRYLAEAGPIFCALSAERDLISSDAHGASGTGLLAVGGPAFDARPAPSAESKTAPIEVAGAAGLRSAMDDCAEFRSTRFEALPASAREASDAASTWDLQSESSVKSLALLGEDASEAAFKSLAPGRRALHVATHAFFLSESCAPAAEGARGISRLKQGGSSAIPPRAEGLLYLSGLAFSGANQRASAGPGEEDGILTAEEIATLDLSCADLVVLSACDTGVGKVAPGEGVLGLRRAFELAGARTVVSTLWPVDDASTRAWMRAFYAPRLARGTSTAESAREACREVLDARRAKGETTHPFFWAAFVAHGR